MPPKAASLAAVDAVRLNTDSAQDRQNRRQDPSKARARESHCDSLRHLRLIATLTTLAKELHKAYLEEEEEQRQEERELKTALALIQSAGHFDRRTQHLCYSTSTSSHSDRRSVK